VFILLLPLKLKANGEKENFFIPIIIRCFIKRMYTKQFPIQGNPNHFLSL